MASKYVIGIDVGGTWIRVGLIDAQLNVIKKTSAKTSNFTNILSYLNGLKEMLQQVDPQKLANQIGMVVPGPFKEQMTHFKDATNVPFLGGVAIAEIRAFFPDYKIVFENDVNVVALLESSRKEYQHLNSLIYMTVSTGIGSGIVINGEIWQGASGYAGEVGNMIVARGRIWEDLCSGLALEKTAKSLYGEDAKAKTLFEAYIQKDKQALEAIQGWFDTFTDALASLIHIINPEILILGGAVIENNPWLIEALKKQTKPKLLENLRENLKIESSHYGSDSGLLGGARLCLIKP